MILLIKYLNGIKLDETLDVVNMMQEPPERPKRHWELEWQEVHD